MQNTNFRYISIGIKPNVFNTDFRHASIHSVLLKFTFRMDRPKNVAPTQILTKLYTKLTFGIL